MRRLVTLLASLGLLATIVSGQQSPPTFRAGVDAIAVDAFVTDRDGRPVPNLTIEDFDMFEDGKPQRITSFSEVNIPVHQPEPYSPTAVEPDVATNAAGEGRLYVIAFDELSPIPGIAGDDTSPAALALRARQFLHAFIEQHFEANDIGIVVSVGRARSGDMQDFTSSRRLLLKAIDSYGGGFPPTDDVSVQEKEQMARSQARALRDLMESLARIQGRRKAVIYIANGVGESAMTAGRANVWDVIDYKGGVRSIQFDDLRAAMTAAMRGGIAFYPFDPSGADPQQVGSSENLDRMDSLRKLAAATGGFAVVNSNSYAQAFPRIVAENSNYYVLGFTSANDTRDGRYRRLDVRIRRPGLSVRFRDGYISASKTPERERPKTPPAAALSAGVGESIRTPLANAAVPMTAFAAAYRGPSKDANIVIAVELDASRLGLVERGPSTSGTVEVAAVAVSAGGAATRGQHEQFTLALKPETWAHVQASGIRVVTGMALPPGRYQLRIAGGNTTLPQAGSVMYDLEVPDFSKPPLALSALTLTSRKSEAVLTVPSKTVKPVVTIVPVATREFDAGDTLIVYAEVYDNRAKEPHRLDLTAELRDGSGHRVGILASDARSDGQARQRLEATLPLDVPPGAYVVHVEARSTLPKQPPAMRDVPIRVGGK
jgi:VWFA-related protein